MSNKPLLPRIHTSMRGVQLNMEEMRTQNEQSVAVTGQGSVMRMNARGDTLASGGRIDRRRETIDQDYATQLTGKVKNVDVRAIEVDTFETPAQVVDRMKREKDAAEARIKETKQAEAAKPAAKNEQLIVEKTETAPSEAPKPARKLIEKDD